MESYKVLIMYYHSHSCWQNIFVNWKIFDSVTIKQIIIKMTQLSCVTKNNLKLHCHAVEKSTYCTQQTYLVWWCQKLFLPCWCRIFIVIKCFLTAIIFSMKISYLGCFSSNIYFNNRGKMRILLKFQINFLKYTCLL